MNHHDNTPRGLDGTTRPNPFTPCWQCGHQRHQHLESAGKCNQTLRQCLRGVGYRAPDGSRPAELPCPCPAFEEPKREPPPAGEVNTRRLL